MEKINLTKKEYLGQGFYYNFRNLETGLYTIDSCTEEEYNALALPDAVNPTMEGHIFESASGYSIKVDNDDEQLHENEYCDFEDGYFVVWKDEAGRILGKKLPKGSILEGKIDTKLLTIWQS